VEAIFLDCGACGPQVKRSPLGSAFSQGGALSERYGLVPLFRLLARWSPLHLGIAYTGCLTIAAICTNLSATSGALALRWTAWALGVGAFSLLFTVVTWYRDDDTLAAAFLVVVITTIGVLAALGLAALVFTGSIGPLVFLAAQGAVTLLIRLALWIPVTMGLIWIGRRLRRFFAPATMNDERYES
jgi:hypothetical protein